MSLDTMRVCINTHRGDKSCPWKKIWLIIIHINDILHNNHPMNVITRYFIYDYYDMILISYIMIINVTYRKHIIDIVYG
jgi:hypothetical protein